MKGTQDIFASLRSRFFSVAGVYMLGLPLTFLAQMLLARLVSVEEFGAFGFALSTATVLSIPVIAGLPMLLTREVAKCVHSDNIAKYRALLLSANGWVVIVAILAVGGITAASHYSSNSSVSFLKEHSVFFALLIPLLGLNSVRSGVMKGLGHPGLSEIPTQIFLPLSLIGGYWALHSQGWLTNETALLHYALSTFLVFVAALLMLWYCRPRQQSARRFDWEDWPKWVRSMLPFAMMSAIWTLNAQIAIFLLGIFGDLDDVAAMRVAERAAMLISFPMMFVNAIISPLIVQHNATNDRLALRQLLRYAARMACLAALPVAIALAVFGKWLLAVTFGAPYDQIAYVPMIILVTGHAISLFFGPAGICLVMCSRENTNLAIQASSLALLCILTIVLVEMYGAVGAAVAASASLVFASSAAFACVRRYLNVNSSAL